jgi:hypothetical protein
MALKVKAARWPRAAFLVRAASDVSEEDEEAADLFAAALLAPVFRSAVLAGGFIR